MPSKLERAVSAVDRAGILLVYPLKGGDDPPSLWSTLYPRSTMRWAWDEEADSRVWELWQLREKLAVSRRVVYAKWFRGRATLFSRDVFRSLLARLRSVTDLRRGLAPAAMRVLSVLHESSPQATKGLRLASGLSGKENEGAYTRALKQLWTRLAIVGAGEANEGGYPSLSIGATELLFEDLWNDAEDASRASLVAGERAIARSKAWTSMLDSSVKQLETAAKSAMHEADLERTAFVARHDIWGPRERR